MYFLGARAPLLCPLWMCPSYSIRNSAAYFLPFFELSCFCLRAMTDGRFAPLRGGLGAASLYAPGTARVPSYDAVVFLAFFAASLLHGEIIAPAPVVEAHRMPCHRSH